MDYSTARLPCPPLSPWVCSKSCPSSQWCHPAISCSVVPFSSCPQSLPASGFFPMSQFFASGGQSIGVSASASVLPLNIQGWFPLGWTGWISLQSKGLSGVFSNTTVQKHQFLSTQPSLWSSSHIYKWLLEKPLLWLYTSLPAKWCLCFLILSRFVMLFLLRSKQLLVSWLQSPSADFGAQENKICHCFQCSPFYLPWSDGTRCYDLSFLKAEFKPAFSLFSFTLIKRF